MLYNDVFKATILKAREEKGITQETLAERSGLSRAYISRLERGINQPKLITVFKISAGFGIEATDLIGRMQRLIDKNSIKLDLS